MSVCMNSFGYNWNGQVDSDFNRINSPGHAIVRTIFKIADYCPLISIVTGIFRAWIHLVDVKQFGLGDSPNTQCDKVFSIIRGIVSTCQLGIIFLPIDLIMTVVNGILSYKENN